MVWCHTFLGNLGTDTCAKWVLVSRFPRMIYITNKTTVKPEEFNKLVCVWGHNLPKHYFPKSGLNWIDWCWLLYYNASCWFLQSSPFTFENNKVWIKTKSVLSRKMIICAIIIYKIQKKKKRVNFALRAWSHDTYIYNYYSTHKPVMNTMTKGPNINLWQLNLEFLMR